MEKILFVGLITKGLTRDEIAKEICRSRSSVDRWLAKYKLSTKKCVDTNLDTRKCRHCKKEHPINEFPGDVCNTNGKFYRRWLCNKCYVRSKTEYKQGMSEWLEEIKKQHCCVKCGEDDFRVLDFHHRGGKREKAFNIAESASRFGREKILAELVKCDAMCANCHRVLTYEDRKEKQRKYWKSNGSIKWSKIWKE